MQSPRAEPRRKRLRAVWGRNEGAATELALRVRRGTGTARDPAPSPAGYGGCPACLGETLCISRPWSRPWRTERCLQARLPRAGVQRSETYLRESPVRSFSRSLCRKDILNLA